MHPAHWSSGAGNDSYSAKLDAKLEKDRPAYRELRKQGFQPPSVLGAASLAANATTPAEIQMGRILPNADKVQSVIDNYKGETGKSLLTLFLLTHLDTPIELNNAENENNEASTYVPRY